MAKRCLFGAFILLMICLSLSCGQQISPSPEANTQMSADKQEPNSCHTENNSTENDPSDGSLDDSYGIWREPDKIIVYPFSEEEISNAYNCALSFFRSKVSDPDVEPRLAYDPILTDIRVRQQISNAPHKGWVEEDYYSLRICFCLNRTSMYELRRESVDAPWMYYDGGVPVGEHSEQAMTIDELSSLQQSQYRILGGYEISEAEHWLYVVDDTTKQTSLCCVKDLAEPDHG